MLTTSATAVAPGALRVTLAVDDEFTSSPTFGKQLLIGLLVASLLATAVLLARVDRGTERPPRPRRFGRPRIVDAVVPVVIGFWTLVAPATDDDGYYAAMARNARISGEVGNYYQLYDQNFTPFTWFYYVLGWWQGVVGDAPVLQRLLAVAFGLLTWVLLRRFAADAMARSRRTGRACARPATSCWRRCSWPGGCPQDMGVRPEGVVCVCAVAAMHAVLVAWRREAAGRRMAGVRAGRAGLRRAPHGFTLLAPLSAGLPLLWRLVAVPGDAVATALRALAVVSGGMVAPLMAFVDGGLRDFLRGQRIFLSIQPRRAGPRRSSATPSCWARCRWATTPSGRGAAVPAEPRVVRGAGGGGADAAGAAAGGLWFSGSTTALAFAALWLTPSKWTHHFGALAGVGTAFLALFLALAVPTVRSVLGMWRLPYGLVAAAAGSYVLAIALSWHGPNQWPYAWLDGVRRPTFTPAIKHVLLDSPLLWLLALVVVVGGLVASGRVVGTRDPRLNVLRAVPILVVISLAFTTVYTVVHVRPGRGAGSAARLDLGAGSFRPRPRAVRGRCRDRGARPVLAVPLAEAPGLPAPPPATGFVNGGGYYAGNRPQGAPGSGVGQPRGARRGVGGTHRRARSPRPGTRCRTPRQGAGGTVTVIAAGSLADGVRLRAEYGRRAGDAVEGAGTEVLTDAAHDPSWRNRGPGADGRRGPGAPGGGRRVGAIHGWLAFSAPVVARPVALADLLPRDAPVALGWPLAFGWPCQRQPGSSTGSPSRPRSGCCGGRAARCRASRTGRSSRRAAVRSPSCPGRSRCSSCDGEAGRPERAGRRVRQPLGPRPLHVDREPADRERHGDAGRPTHRRLTTRFRIGGGSAHGRLTPSPYGRSVLSPPRPATPPADLGARATPGRARLVLASAC
jgi:hypothetical protein